MLFDEYSAYKEANELYPEMEEKLNSSQEIVLKVFLHMSRGELTGATSVQLFMSFYDYCSALIVHSIVDDSFPRDKSNLEFVKTCNNFMKDLKEAYNRMPLNYDEYKILGATLLNDLLEMFPYDKREYFKHNTRMPID